MASTNNNSIRQTHVSPGIYTKETDLTYAAKSLGITTLGVVGETVKGPAFQPIFIENWREFQNYFGGTNPEKFRGSQYPKYELPYIAQSYLKQSNQLQVVRVLGLSGVNAGPAWFITASKERDGVIDPDAKYADMVVAVLRSRGEHNPNATLIREKNLEAGECTDKYEFDGITYYAKSVTIDPSNTLTYPGECSTAYDVELGTFASTVLNYGRFTIIVTDNDGNESKYAVSLNDWEENYILKVLGTDPENGSSEIYVEELYDVALKQLVSAGELNCINDEIVEIPQSYLIPKYKAVDDFIYKNEEALTRKDRSKRFLYASKIDGVDTNIGEITVHVTEDDGINWSTETAEEGHIYTVIAHTSADGTREFWYVENRTRSKIANQETKAEVLSTDHTFVDETGQPGEGAKIFQDLVRVKSMDKYYANFRDNGIMAITLDPNNYKEQYRYASTPWIVSEMKGSANNVELNKLFRFHTISDGDASNTEVKVSIENILPDDGTFDVVVRDFYDTDASRVILERYKGVNLIPGDRNYIALRIGSFDEQYANISKYITVEVNENEKTMISIPAGFLGYPTRNYNGQGAVEITKRLTAPYFKYNTYLDEDIRTNKQYFGVSDLTGIDEDILKYKGVEAYDENPEGLTPCFHLDARIISIENDYASSETGEDVNQEVTVDGVGGYKWVTVSLNNINDTGVIPRIGSEETMANTLYEDKRTRKFTVVFYGGFDGWDYYRVARSNGDEFKYNKYKGHIDYSSGEGTMFSVVEDPQLLNFNAGEKVITSDWYAYMSGIRLLTNPKTIDINVFATPGIDYVNQPSLVNDTIELIEEERADSIYVVTTPDKPYGAGDTLSEMYNAQDVVDNLYDSDIDSNYTCSYYPWVKYYDADNAVYIYLPPTRDVVRNFAYTDNTRYPWFAAAGWDRGNLEDSAVKPKRTLRLVEQDTLYDGRLNFINCFANEGMKIWGDKNMQVGESQMNRISKRRLLLHIRKLCAIAAIGLLFDPNDNTTKQSFESAVTPILDNVMSNRGITDWRLEIDDSQEARDRLELPATIYIKPTPNLEYITINFVITPSGVSFDDI